MSTPNGQHPADPNGTEKQAASTVLALDGWGPVMSDSAVNGTNGSEHEAPTEVELTAPRAGWLQSLRSNWANQLQHSMRDPQSARILAPAAAMIIAVAIAVRIGIAWRTSIVAPLPEPAPPNPVATLRRKVALAIDPTLEPTELQRNSFLEQFRSTLSNATAN